MTFNSLYKIGFEFYMSSMLLFINHCVSRLHYTHAMGLKLDLNSILGQYAAHKWTFDAECYRTFLVGFEFVASRLLSKLVGLSSG